MLELKNITWSLPDGREVIKDVSLSIPKGKLVVVTGPNGGGKITLAKIIAGIATPDSGKLILEGEDITELDNNVELFKKEYPAVLKAELDAMVKAYPEDRRFKEDMRMFQRLFGSK